MLGNLMQTAQQPDFATLNKPFKEQVKEAKQELVTRPKEDKKIKPLISYPTGTFIDTLFLDAEGKPIGGLPLASNSILVGIPNTGKSLIVSEIALRKANDGKKVLFITSEEVFSIDNGRYDLESRFKERAKVLGLDWKKISQNLFVLDIITNADLREWDTFITTYRSLIENEKVDLVLMDSLTLLEDTRGQLKYRLGVFMKYNQLNGITAIYVSQRSSDDTDAIGNLAGGISLSHIADIVMEMDFKKVWSGDSQMKQDIPTAKQGMEINFFKVLKNRLSRLDGHYILYTIDQNGIIQATLPQPL